MDRWMACRKRKENRCSLAVEDEAEAEDVLIVFLSVTVSLWAMENEGKCRDQSMNK
jgi:hypothetical protein